MVVTSIKVFFASTRSLRDRGLILPYLDKPAQGPKPISHSEIFLPGALVHGTLNQRGEMPKPEAMRFIAHRYYNEALKQCPPGKPSAIFVDLNLPPEVNPSEHHIPWWSDMKQMLNGLPEPGPTEPAVES
jgi:hypothetical protein